MRLELGGEISSRFFLARFGRTYQGSQKTQRDTKEKTLFYLSSSCLGTPTLDEKKGKIEKTVTREVVFLCLVSPRIT